MGFDQLIGQEAVKARLKDIVSAPSACSLLFSGPEGIGKHLYAKETAKAVLCQHRNAGGACGECASCKYIEAGTHPDLVEVEPTEGRKNIRIADLREVVRDAQVKPQISDHKVIVINADKIANDCQNLLLKSLEEPDEHLVYILLCSDTSKLLGTIQSRVTELNFREYTAEQMEKILKAHGGDDLSDEKISFLTTFSSGIPGKAISLINDSDFMEERDYIFNMIMKMPKMGYTDILYDEFSYFDKNRDKMDELLLLIVWTLGDIAAAIAVPDPSGIKNVDKKKEIIRFVSENNAITLINISNAEKAVTDYVDASRVNTSFETSCCNMLLRIHKELCYEKSR
ncbi:MAG: hypothetical protein ILA15_07715 [Clostridiales bacterium]|nr:hypothetical protein [Clostridiales bacterium]